MVAYNVTGGLNARGSVTGLLNNAYSGGSGSIAQFPTMADFPEEGNVKTLYVDQSTGNCYVWIEDYEMVSTTDHDKLTNRTEPDQHTISAITGLESVLSSKQEEIDITGILKGTGSGNISAATANTDYQTPLVANTDYATPDSVEQSIDTALADYATKTELDDKQTKINANGLLKGLGNGSISAAVAGTDYQTPLTAGTDYATPSAVQSAYDLANDAVPKTRTINNKALASNIALTASDVGALPDSTFIPTATSDLTNDSGFITANDIGDVFTIKGSVYQYSDLPATGNTVGDVYYVEADETISGVIYPGQVGYIWITINQSNRWEELGQTIDTSTLQTTITANGVLQGDGNGRITAKSVDTIPTNGSASLITSGAVYAAIIGAIEGAY